MKREITRVLGVIAIIIVGVAWGPVSRFVLLSSACSREPLDVFEKRMDSVTNGMTKASVLERAGNPCEIRDDRQDQQLVYQWKGISGFSLHKSQIRQDECEYAFNIREGVVAGHGRSPARGVPNQTNGH